MAYAHANFEPKHQGEYLDILRRCTETEERRLALDEAKELRLSAKADRDEEMAEFKRAKEERLAMQAELAKERAALAEAKEERLGVQAEWERARAALAEAKEERLAVQTEIEAERTTLASAREARLRERWNRISGNVPPDEVRTATSHDYRAHIADLRVQQDGRCPLCGERLPDDDGQVHLDHITPLRSDGEISVENLQAVHAACNLAKG